MGELKKGVGIAIGVVAAIVSVALVLAVRPSFIPGVATKGEIIIDPLIDEETGKPIGRTDGGYPHVFLDGIDQGYVTDYGEVRISGVEPGTHELLVVVPNYGEVRRFITIEPGEAEEIHTEIDMPNPIFETSVRAWHHLSIIPPDEIGDVEVTLTNMGDVDSQDTIALIFVYLEENPTQCVGSRTLRFGNIAPGADPVPKDVHDLTEFAWLQGEYVVVVIVDRWEFTPEDKLPVSEVEVPEDILAEWVEQAVDYVKQHPEVIGSIIRIIIPAVT